MKKYYLGVILVLLSALGYGLMPIFASLAYRGHINVSTLLLIRFSIAAVLFFVYIFFFIKQVRISKAHLLYLILLGGGCYTLQSNLYFSSIKLIPSSMAVLILYAYPALVSLFDFLTRVEKFSLKIVFSLILSTTGLILVLGSSNIYFNTRGVLYAFGAALVYSVYVVVSKRVVKDLQPVVMSAYITLFTSISLLGMGMITKDLNFSFTPFTWYFIIGLVLFSTVLAMLTFFKGLDILGSSKASVLSMMEPVFTILLSMILLKERLGIYQMIGGVTVILGALVIVLSSHGEKTE